MQSFGDGQLILTRNRTRKFVEAYPFELRERSNRLTVVKKFEILTFQISTVLLRTGTIEEDGKMSKCRLSTPVQTL
jgi:hypothetical protein